MSSTGGTGTGGEDRDGSPTGSSGSSFEEVDREAEGLGVVTSFSFPSEEYKESELLNPESSVS